MSLSSDPLVPRRTVPPDPPPSPPMSARNKDKAHAMGLTSATGLVVGSIVGTGVFTMPAVLAGAGTMGIVVLGVIAVGAMMLAVLFGQLAKRVPNSDGGLYAYSRHEFGDFAGYLVGWCYWIQAWAGNAAIVSSWVFYVDALFKLSNPSGMENWGIAVVGVWVPAVVNLAGVLQMAWFQNVTVVLKFLPLLFVGVVGWFFARSADFGPFNASGGGLSSGIGRGQAGEGSSPQRRPRLGSRHRGQRDVVRAGDRGGDGARRASHAHQDRGAVRQCLPVHLPPQRVGRAVHRGRGRHLGHRGPERLDVDRDRDVAGHRPGRPVPPAVRLGRPQRDCLVRHRGRDGAAVAAHVVALHHELGTDGIHLPGRPHRGHRGHPVFHVGHRPAHLSRLPPPARAGLGLGP